MSIEDTKEHLDDGKTSLPELEAGGKEVDDTLLVVEQQVSEEEFNQLRKRIDRFIMPILMCIYGLQYVDKQSLSSGVVFGLKTDTHLVGQQYAYLTLIFYIAYMVAEIPLAYLMQRLHLGRLLSIVVIIWGALVMCLAACNSWAPLMVVRALLGLCEASVTPGFLLLVGAWYKKSEHSARSLSFFVMNSTFTGIFSLMIYGIAKHSIDHGGMSGWRVINLFLGACTVFAGIMALIFLGSPDEVFWLTKEQKVMAKARIIQNGTGTAAGGGVIPWKWEQAKSTFRDPQFWFVIALNFVATVPSGALGTFGTLVYVGFGFTNLESILYNLPSCALQIMWVVGCMFLIKRWPKIRFYLMMFSTVVPFVAFLALGTMKTDTNKWTKWVIYQGQFTFTFPTFAIWTLLPSNTAGRTKKSVMSAATFIAYSVGQIVGSQTFRANDAPRYIRGLTVTSVFFAIQFFILGAWKWWYERQNAARDRECEVAGISSEERERLNKIAGEADMTDRENRYFKYDC